MKKVMALVIFAMLVTGCASKQAAEVLRQSERSFEVFEGDYTKLSTISLEREWDYMERIRKAALHFDTQKSSYSGAEAKALVEKFLAQYEKDIHIIDRQRAEHTKALYNSRTGIELMQSAIEYHEKGIAPGEVDEYLTNELIPTLEDIMNSGDNKEGE